MGSFRPESPVLQLTPAYWCTLALEQEIRQLSSKGNLSKQDKDQLASLRAEVSRINKAKTECQSSEHALNPSEPKLNLAMLTDVEAHPEHRKFVFPERPNEQSDAAGPGDEPVGLYDKNGRLKHPERSVYYDPVFNPYGAPPPGMPYREKRA